MSPEFNFFKGGSGLAREPWSQHVYVIVGAGGFLGRHLVRDLLGLGGHVVGVDEVPPTSLLEQSQLENFTAIQGDMGSNSTIEALRMTTANLNKKLGGLVVLAAPNPPPALQTHSGMLDRINLDSFCSDIAAHLRPALGAIKALDPIFRAQKYGSIVLVGSDLSVIGPDQRLYSHMKLGGEAIVKSPSYVVGKHGLVGLMRFVATYYLNSEIRCNILAPGPVHHPDIDSNLREKLVKLIPMGRLGTVDGVVGSCLFLLSLYSDFVNGSVMVIDGGRTAW